MKTLEIIVNNKCDKQCKYCYENNNGDCTISYEMIQNTIDLISKKNIWNKSILFFGGEPTISLPVIKMVVDKNPNIAYKIITNGYFLNLKKEDYSFMKNFGNVNISLEGTERAFNEIRNGKNLRDKIDEIIKLKWKNIIINISINGFLYNNEEEFINNIKYILDNGLQVHLYQLKSDFYFELEDYINFLKKIKKLDENIFNLIILNNGINDDMEYLCTFDENIVLNCDGNLVKCARDLDIIDKEDILLSLSKAISLNHRKNYEGCSNCEVELGKCQTSCPAFIKECIKTGNLDLLNKLCLREKIHHKLRIGEWIL